MVLKISATVRLRALRGYGIHVLCKRSAEDDTFTYKSRAHAVHERSAKDEDIYKTSEYSLFVRDQLRMSTFIMPGSTCSPKRSTKDEYIYKGRELLFVFFHKRSAEDE